ncbi:hypothetical protein QF19_004805 [Salmonella enterica subsp. enterica]|nr:hypothetical protein [Salmonella enterica subsp. enterica]
MGGMNHDCPRVFHALRLKEKRKAGVLTKNATPISDYEMVESGKHQ